jgi:protein-S-isoprenylcysteine O-methyltransferase Ste14
MVNEKGWQSSSFFCIRNLCIFAPLKKQQKKMALIQSMEATGAKLFKYRGQIPVLIFALSLPILFFTNDRLYASVHPYWGEPVYTACAIISLLLVFAGLTLRAYTVCTTPKGTSGRNTAQQVADHLNTKGIYSVVRHPLYLANYLIWAGLLVYTMNAFAFIIVSLVYWIYYERIMMTEEAFLRSKYGDEFEQWAAKVPAFIPKWSLYEGGMLQFSWKTFIRREYATIMSVIFSYFVIDYLLFYLIDVRHCPETADLNYLRPSLYIAAGYTIIALLIKLIKHKTNWLDATPDRD